MFFSKEGLCFYINLINDNMLSVCVYDMTNKQYFEAIHVTNCKVIYRIIQKYFSGNVNDSISFECDVTDTDNKFIKVSYENEIEDTTVDYEIVLTDCEPNDNLQNIQNYIKLESINSHIKELYGKIDEIKKNMTTKNINFVHLIKYINEQCYENLIVVKTHPTYVDQSYNYYSLSKHSRDKQSRYDGLFSPKEQFEKPKEETMKEFLPFLTHVKTKKNVIELMIYILNMYSFYKYNLKGDIDNVNFIIDHGSYGSDCKKGLTIKEINDVSNTYFVNMYSAIDSYLKVISQYDF